MKTAIIHYWLVNDRDAEVLYPSVDIERLLKQKRDELYLQAKAFIFSGIEDFGSIPAEAQAAGCPVIACGQGGALEIVTDGKTGVFFAEQIIAALLFVAESVLGVKRRIIRARIA
jgi:glycosyltransferase involved in cell wall biosynthesis